MRRIALLVAVGCAMHTPKAPHRQRQSERELRFQRLDDILQGARREMCAELGRSVPPPPPRSKGWDGSPESRLAACEAGDAELCFWSAEALSRGIDRGAAGETLHPDRDPVRARELYERSCKLGENAGCWGEERLMREAGDRDGRVRLFHDVCEANRLELCGAMAHGFDATERIQLAADIAIVRAKLESACPAGDDRACELRGDLECAVDRPCPGRLAWDVEACKAGSSLACRVELKRLDGDSLGVTEAVIERACHHGGCAGLLAELHESCRGGAWSSCYIAARACTRGPGVAHRWEYEDDDDVDD